jgi:alanyl-tRNA synthetase
MHLGDHVHQAGSLVSPDRLRFDFTNHGPVKAEVLAAIEHDVNEGIWSNAPVVTTQKPYAEAVASGAMALFGEKYGDVVRVVDIPGLSTELCGGTHVRTTGEITLFKIVQETGVAAGVRRVEALTGRAAYDYVRAEERTLDQLRDTLKASGDALVKRVESLVAEVKTLEKKLADAQKGGAASAMSDLLAKATMVGPARVIAEIVDAADVKALHGFGDQVREALVDGVAFLGAAHEDGKATLLVVVGDALRERGVSAGDLVKAINAKTGARGGGKPHMAQSGFASLDAVREALPVAGRVATDVLGGLS